MTHDFNGRKIIITGGAAGIGLAAASQLMQAGASVALLDLDGAAAKASAAKLHGTGKAFGFAADVTQ